MDEFDLDGFGPGESEELDQTTGHEDGESGERTMGFLRMKQSKFEPLAAEGTIEAADEERRHEERQKRLARKRCRLLMKRRREAA